MKGDTKYEMWVVPGSVSDVLSEVEPQLPISRSYGSLPWCKTVTKADETRWLWGSPDDGLSVSVYPDKYQGTGTRVAIMTGMDGGFLATDCAA